MSPILTVDEHRQVTAAVAAAEAHTSGEIVTVVADRSDGNSDIALAWAALAGFTLLVAASLFPAPLLHLLETIGGGWNAAVTASAILAAGAALAIAGFLLALALQMADAVRFALIPGRIRTDRVHDRAIAVFKVGAERRTDGRTGILIYLSMREHRAEILADEAIAAQVPDEVWGEAMAAMLARLKRGETAAGMIAAIERVGAVLAEHLPRADDDRNEIPDRLIEL